MIGMTAHPFRNTGVRLPERRRTEQAMPNFRVGVLLDDQVQRPHSFISANQHEASHLRTPYYPNQVSSHSVLWCKLR